LWPPLDLLKEVHVFPVLRGPAESIVCVFQLIMLIKELELTIPNPAKQYFLHYPIKDSCA